MTSNTKQDGEGMDQEGQVSESRDIKEVPYQWLRFGMTNKLQLYRGGHVFLLNGIEQNGSTVYKFMMDEYWIMVCDHIGINALFDMTKVKRDDLAAVNLNLLKGHVPCMNSNGKEHKVRKEFFMEFMKDAVEKLTINEIFEAIKLEFEKMESLDFSNVKDAEEYNFEMVFQRAAGNLMSWILLGEYIEPVDLMFQWFAKWNKRDNDKNNEEAIASALLEKVSEAQKIKRLKVPMETIRDLTYQGVICEIAWSLGINWSGVKASVISSLLCYLRLPDAEKQLLKEEGEMFFSSDPGCLEELLPTLKTTHKFLMEVLRLYPPAIGFFGRARHDFLLASTSGNYQIKEGELLMGYANAVQRNAALFEAPDNFILERPLEAAKKCPVTFAGYWDQEPAGDNRKCPAQSFTIKIVKIFILCFTKCVIIPTEQPGYTGQNFARKELASDKPLHVLKFRYDN